MSLTTAGVTLEGGKFKNGAMTGALAYAVSHGAKAVADSIRSPDDPAGAQYKSFVSRKNLDLELKDGVLSGELDVGCATYTSHCDTVFEQLRSINESDKINIKFNRVDVYDSVSNLDIEINFTSGVGAGSYSTGQAASSFLGIEWGYRPDVLNIDYGRANTSTVLHEFGHALGHVHMFNSSESIMSYHHSRNSNFTDAEVNSILRPYQ